MALWDDVCDELLADPAVEKGMIFGKPMRAWAQLPHPSNGDPLRAWVALAEEAKALVVGLV